MILIYIVHIEYKILKTNGLFVYRNELLQHSSH